MTSTRSDDCGDIKCKLVRACGRLDVDTRAGAWAGRQTGGQAADGTGKLTGGRPGTGRMGRQTHGQAGEAHLSLNKPLETLVGRPQHPLSHVACSSRVGR